MGEGEIFPYRSLSLLSFPRKLADLKEGFFKGSFCGLIKKARFQDKRLETSFLLLRDRKVASCRRPSWRRRSLRLKLTLRRQFEVKHFLKHLIFLFGSRVNY